MIWLARQPSATSSFKNLFNKILSVSPLPLPNSQCSVCRVVYLPVSFVPTATLGEFVEKVVVGALGWYGHVIVQEGSRVLWETEDFEDNGEKKMQELGLKEGVFITVLDDDEPHYPVSFAISTFVLLPPLLVLSCN